MRHLLLRIFFSGWALAACVNADLPPIDEQKEFELLDDEAQLWNRAREEQAKLDASGDLYDDPELTAYVNAVAQRLVPEDVRSKGIGVEIKIIKNPLLNAFAYPNCIIYVHTGMLAKMENEAQLAALLGHEMSHIIHRHAVESYRNVKNTTAVLATAQIAMAPFGAYGSLASVVGLLGATAAVTGYSRSHESEADVTGLALMVAAGYDPRQAPLLFEHLKNELEEQDIQEPFFFGTHPRLQERVDNYARLLGRQYAEANGIVGENVFLEKMSELFLVNAAMDIAIGRYLSGSRCIQKSLRGHPDNAAAHFMLGELYRQRAQENDLNNALRAYENAVRCNPAYASAYRGLGQIYYKKKEKQKAGQAFENYLTLNPDAEDAPYIRYYLRQLTPHRQEKEK